MNPGQKIIHKSIIYFLIALVSILFSCNKKGNKTGENIWIITGGHEFEPSFYKIFDSYVDVKYDIISQPRFNHLITTKMFDQYTALVFYDMWQEINDEEKQAFLGLLDKGQGMVFLHHALVSYQHWDEFEKIVGGKYIETEFYNDPNMKGA